jgi:hypothetical protein
VPTDVTRKSFAYLLYSASRIVDDDSIPVIGKEIMDTFLIYASHSPDILNCYAHIEYGAFVDNHTQEKNYGFKFKNHNLSLSQLLSKVINHDNFVRGLRSRNRRKLTGEEWQSVYQFSWCILKTFERTQREIERKLSFVKRDFSYKLFAYSFTINDENLPLLSQEIIKVYWWYLSELLQNDKVIENNHLEFGYVDRKHDGPKKTYGLKIRGKRLLLSDAMFIGESFQFPPELSSLLSINEDEWRAFKLMIPMILMAFERYHHETLEENL